MGIKSLVAIIAACTAVLASPPSRFDNRNALATVSNHTLDARQTEGFVRCGVTSEGSPAHAFGRANVRVAVLNVRVKLYFHVLATGPNLEDGWLSDTILQSQADVLNTHFASTGISFDWQRAETTRNNNEAWNNVPSDWIAGVDIGPRFYPWELSFKTVLKKGGSDLRVLNVYFMTAIYPLLGQCTLPPLDRHYANWIEADGCIVNSNSLPGFPNGPASFNEGKTLVHEVGHWLGLLHPWQGRDCYGANDEIEDTAPALKATYECAEDSCPPPFDNKPDPNDNFMSYAYDRCMNKFTPNQITRMEDMWALYRAGGNGTGRAGLPIR